MPIAGLGAQQELQEAQATAEGWPIGKGVTRDDQRLGALLSTAKFIWPAVPRA